MLSNKNDIDLFLNIINKAREDIQYKEKGELNGTEFISGRSREFIIEMENTHSIEPIHVIYTLGLN